MNSIKDSYLLDCSTYDDYLDTFVRRNDLKYLRNIKFSRMLVELGYRSTNEILSSDQYETRKNLAQEAVFPTKKSVILFSEGVKITDPVLKELASREKANYEKIISTIVFLSHRTKSGFEISGYIDLEESLRKANKKLEGALDWKAIFEMRKSLKPQPTDLSFYNWRSNQISYNNSENYSIVHDSTYGLLFMYKGDRKMVCVDPNQEVYMENATRTLVHSEKYDVVLYDHLIRRKI